MLEARIEAERIVEMFKPFCNGLNSSNEYDGMNDTIYILDETDQKINVIMEKLKKL